MPRTAALALLLALAAPPTGAQTFVLDVREELDFDRPEAWAMAWFGAVTLANGVGGATALAPGEIELAFTGAWVPALSEAERRVGFGGNKVEDLNRTPVVGRPLVTIGVPGGWTVELGWMPPLDVEGISPDLRSLALSRPLWRGARVDLGLRLLGEDGAFRGDLTCSRADVAAGPDLDSRVFIDCDAPSEDELLVRLYGLELQTALRTAGASRLTPYAAVGWNRLDAELRIDARYNGGLDRTRLVTEGDFWTAAAGLAWDLRPGWRLGGELFYAPLDVVRTSGGRRENDALLHGRLLLAYRLR